MKKTLPIFLSFFCSLDFVLAQTPLCDSTYWAHTYTNSRLKIYDGCRTVTGTISFILTPADNGDGDYHIYIYPDSQYAWMVDYRDTAYVQYCQGDDSFAYNLIPNGKYLLNSEEVCKGTPDPSDSAVVNAACSGFSDTVYLPGTGEYMEVTGPFVYDIVHCWNELHPISRMVIATPTNIPEPEGKSFLDGMKIFPQPANEDMEFEFDHPPHAVTFIKFYNNVGRLVAQYGMAETGLLYVNTSVWGAGEYAYNIVSQEQNKVLKSGMISVVH